MLQGEFHCAVRQLQCKEPAQRLVLFPVLVLSSASRVEHAPEVALQLPCGSSDVPPCLAGAMAALAVDGPRATQPIAGPTGTSLEELQLIGRLERDIEATRTMSYEWPVPSTTLDAAQFRNAVADWEAAQKECAALMANAEEARKAYAHAAAVYLKEMGVDDQTGAAISPRGLNDLDGITVSCFPPATRG